MKLQCSVIEDLLPLYHDGICSGESRSLVDEHLNECEACTALLSKIDEELQHPADSSAKANPLKAIQTAWNKSKRKSYIKGTIISIFACAAIVFGYLVLTQAPLIPVPSELITISEVSMLSDGRIIYHIYISDDKELNRIDYINCEDGSMYCIPKRPIIKAKRQSDTGMYNRYNTIRLDDDVSSVYAGPVGEGVLVWEEGMELPPASAELEERYLIENVKKRFDPEREAKLLAKIREKIPDFEGFE